MVRTIGVHLFLEDRDVYNLSPIGYKHHHTCHRGDCKTENLDCSFCDTGVCEKCTWKHYYFRGIESMYFFLWLSW